MKLNGEIAERPQQMLMRVSVGITKMILGQPSKPTTHVRGMVYTCYTHIIQFRNSKTTDVLLLLLTTKEDSINGISDTLKSCAQISQSAGGWSFYS